MSGIMEKICPVCGEKFVRTPDWVYKRMGVCFCSWGCKLKNERDLTKRKKKCMI